MTLGRSSCRHVHRRLFKLAGNEKENVMTTVIDPKLSLQKLLLLKARRTYAETAGRCAVGGASCPAAPESLNVQLRKS